MTYLLDSNVFIEAKNRHYGFDFCPAFWSWLDEQHATGLVASVAKVRDELLEIADELATWAREREGFFIDSGAVLVSSLTNVSEWATNGSYTAAAQTTFLSSADYYLVAQAHSDNLTVVTHEVSSDGRNRIKIPDACAGVGVECVSPYAMLKAEGARFVLGPSARS